MNRCPLNEYTEVTRLGFQTLLKPYLDNTSVKYLGI